MNSESGFFDEEFTGADRSIWLNDDSFHDITLVHRSATGFTEIHCGRRRGKRFAIKCLKTDYRNDPIARALIYKEFAIGYNLDHPAVVRTESLEEIDGLGICIIMEWVDGITLADAISQGKLADNEITAILKSLAAALDYIHDKQIVHRDLKPSNILLAGGSLSPKIIDFGFSDTADFEILKQSAGTAAYAAPEQLTGREIDTHADTYAFGRIILEMIEGQRHRRLRRIALGCMSAAPDKRPSNLSSLPWDSRASKAVIAVIVILTGFIALVSADIFYRLHRAPQMPDVLHDTIVVVQPPEIDSARIEFLNSLPAAIDKIVEDEYSRMLKRLGSREFTYEEANQAVLDNWQKFHDEIDLAVKRLIDANIPHDDPDNFTVTSNAVSFVSKAKDRLFSDTKRSMQVSQAIRYKEE